MNITPSLPHSNTYLCSATFIVNITHQDDKDRTLQAICCHACYFVGLLAITQELHETGQRATFDSGAPGWLPLLYAVGKQVEDKFCTAKYCRYTLS